MKKAALTLLMLATFSYLYCANTKDMGKIIDLTGKVYGRLTVIHRAPHNETLKTKSPLWICKCECGNFKTAFGSNIKKGDTRSCGCLQAERTSKANTIHGESDKTKEFYTWKHIIDRCTNRNNKSYKNYGGRKISVCNRWSESYENFLSDMGRAPSQKHTIDRINNDGNYEPGNCRWATRKEQANNRRSNKLISYNGKAKTLSQWCDDLGMHYKKTSRMLLCRRSVEYTFNFQKRTL